MLTDWNKMEIKLNLILLMMTILLCYANGLNKYPYLCNMFEIEDNYKQLNISNPLDRQVLIEIHDLRNCWVNMTELYERSILTSKVKKIQTLKDKVMIALKFSCEFGITVHFLDFNITDNSEQFQLELDLEFAQCSIIMDEMNLFLKIGKILMLRNSENVIQTLSETNCLYAYYLQGIYLDIICDGNYKLNYLFWESCMQVFPIMALLVISGCEYNTNEINATALQEKFPNLDTLVLESIEINQPIYFPWAKSKTLHNDYIDKLLKAYFDSYKDIYFYNLFPGNSILFVHCKLDTRLLFFKEKVSLIALTGMGLSHLEPNLLHNVTVKQTLNLAQNKLETIDEDLLKNQHKLLHLYLQQNKLTCISHKMFSGLKQLKYINLANNDIKFIEDDPFQSLYHLKDIILMNNSITQIPRDTFKDQTGSLEILEINSNSGITDVPVWPIYSTYLIDLDIRDSGITGDSIIRLLDNLNKLDITEKLVESDMDPSNLPFGNTATIDLSFNRIETIPSENMTVFRMKKFKYLLMNYNIGVDGNPLKCNCDTSVIQEIFSDTTDQALMKENIESWICVNPPEFRSTAMWTIADTEKYCPIQNALCPQSCLCFKRKYQEMIIIDCRDTVLKHMPKLLPKFPLELWFQNSNISEISPLPYLENVTVLNLERNKLGHIEQVVINRLKLLKELHLRSNHLTAIPFQVRSLKLSKLTLSDNPFICDCKTGWLKGWLLEAEHVVPDWTDVKCLDNHDNLQQLIAVPDSDFVCKEDNSFSVTEHVFLPSIIIGSILFVLVVQALLVYFQRFTLKVLLFIHLNLHPFDKQSDRQKEYEYDAVIIYTRDDLEVKVKVESHLLEKGYKVADMYRNSLIGYTYIENIEKLINNSTKVILVMSEQVTNDKIIQAAWNIAYDRAMSSSVNSIILVTDKIVKKQRNIDINLQQFLNSNNFIDSQSKFLKEKIEYLMPKIKPAENQEIEMEQNRNNISTDSDNDEEMRDKIQISYPDEHHFYVKNELIPFLLANNIEARILDMEFTPGADIRDELPIILDASRHTLFILSEESLEDEIRIYILTQALTKTQFENHNFLLLCTAGRIGLEQMTNDLSRYVENYVTISVNDAEFKHRILQSIIHNSRVREDEDNDLEIDPLLQV